MIAFYRQKRLTVAASIVNNPFSAFSLASHYRTPNLVDLTSSVRGKKLTQSEKQQSLFYIFHWLLEWFNKKKIIMMIIITILTVTIILVMPSFHYRLKIFYQFQWGSLIKWLSKKLFANYNIKSYRWEDLYIKIGIVSVNFYNLFYLTTSSNWVASLAQKAARQSHNTI